MKIDFRETAEMALTAVWTNRFRSALTILGIVIGITTVVTVASLFAGLRKGIVDFFQEFGPDNIFIARVSGDPSGQGAGPKELKRRPLSPDYAEYIKRMAPSVQDVGLQIYPQGMLNASVKVPGFETDRFFYAGASPTQIEISPRELKEGRTFTQEEANRASQVCMIGSVLADALFPGESAVGRTIQVAGAEYTVLGVYAPAKGGFFGENGLDTQILVPHTTAKLRFPASNNWFLTAKARQGLREQAMDEVRNVMRRLRKVAPGEEDDFALSTADSIIKNFDRVTGMIVAISIAISALGLLVGGIGVMNIMLVSVTERTREIGVRKAVGARRSDIVTQFLIEAVSLTATGGIVGIVFAILVTLIIAKLVPSLPSSVPAWAVMSGLIVSMAVGLFFGVWPAMKASRLDPVDALRYE